MNHESLINYAYSFIGVKYKWGGNNPLTGFDCSGLICELLRSQGIIKGDMTAQEIFNHLITIGTQQIASSITVGSFLFFGSSKYNIIHCAMAINNKQMIEAGGGGSATVNDKDAQEKNAFIRIRPIKSRNDFIASIFLSGVL